MNHHDPYAEVAEFIASLDPAKVIAFRASAQAKERVGDLIYKEKTTGLSPDETAELDDWMRLEHLMILAKAGAHRLLPSQGTATIEKQQEEE